MSAPLKQLAAYYDRSPDQITQEELRQYFLYLKNEKDASRSTLTVALSPSSSFTNTPCNGRGRFWPLSARPMNRSCPLSFASKRCIGC